MEKTHGNLHFVDAAGTGRIKQPSLINEFGRRVSEKLKADCPDVKWSASYSVLRPYDYVDIFEAQITRLR